MGPPRQGSKKLRHSRDANVDDDGCGAGAGGPGTGPSARQERAGPDGGPNTAQENVRGSAGDGGTAAAVIGLLLTTEVIAAQHGLLVVPLSPGFTKFERISAFVGQHSAWSF